MKNLSDLHKNKQKHNWLIYEIGDYWLLKYSYCYKGRLVDLGCGSASYKDTFLKYADEYIGVDWVKSYHDSKPDVLSNLNESIQLPDNYANTIVSFSVMEHLCEPQVFLNESFRVLSNGGYIVLQVPWMWWIHEEPHDYFRYSPYGLKYMFEKSGFVDIHVQPTSGFFTMWILKFNYFSLKAIKGTKLRKQITTFLLSPLWYVLQKLAPWLDRKHRGWSRESVGFFVVAKKPL